MEWSERVMPRSITTQITGVVAISVLLGIAIVAAIILLLFDPPQDSPAFTVAVRLLTDVMLLLTRTQK